MVVSCLFIRTYLCCSFLFLNISLMTLMTLTLMTGFLDRNETTALLMIFTQR